MDVVQVLASAVQLVSAMVSAVGALEQAAEASRRLQVLENFVSNLKVLMQQANQKHAHKMHGPQLKRQFQSLSRLMDKQFPSMC